MNKICGIYKITSPSGKIYIGQSKNINRRKLEYKNHHNFNYHSKIHKSILKYGWNNHTFEIIHECQESELNELEAHYIKLYNTFDTKHGLNLTSGGDYYEMSEETKIKMKLNKKIKNHWIGRKHSEESKQKMSEAKINNKNALNHKLTEEAKKKISEKNKGKKLSEEQRLRLISINTGRKHTEESRKKISEKNKGKKLSEEHKLQLILINTGRKHTEEAKKKIGEASKNRIVSEETRRKLSIINLGNKNALGRIFKHSEETKQILKEKRKFQPSNAKSYEIYDNNDKLIYKFKANFMLELKKLNLPFKTFSDSYRKNTKISQGSYIGWYVIKL